MIDTNREFTFEVVTKDDPEPLVYEAVTGFSETQHFLILSWSEDNVGGFEVGEIWLPVANISAVSFKEIV